LLAHGLIRSFLMCGLNGKLCQKHWEGDNVASSSTDTYCYGKLPWHHYTLRQDWEEKQIKPGIFKVIINEIEDHYVDQETLNEILEEKGVRRKMAFTRSRALDVSSRNPILP
jgi:hypothetical protein